MVLLTIGTVQGAARWVALPDAIAALMTARQSRETPVGFIASRILPAPLPLRAENQTYSKMSIKTWMGEKWAKAIKSNKASFTGLTVKSGGW
jgi:hypothetical protein